jgi:hypothetical protein
MKPAQKIRIGVLAQQDAVLAYSSALASDLIRRAMAEPRHRRAQALRRWLNEAHPGMGDRAAAEAVRLTSAVGRDQALFDATRLALANRLGAVLQSQVPSVSGLGSSEKDINAVFCGLIGAGTVGGAIGTAFNDPKGASVVGTAGRDVLTAAGCDAGAMRAQAEVAASNLQASQLQAASERAAADRRSQTTMIAVGPGSSWSSSLDWPSWR